jgi:hypothetical protein
MAANNGSNHRKVEYVSSDFRACTNCHTRAYSDRIDECMNCKFSE